ncbi:MAG: AsmA-like C-terminal region-containing protein, partial [Paracoccaceae bacterium]
VTALKVEAPGLTAKGTITTAEGGGLGEAAFDRVQLGNWLDAPLTITGRGPGLPVAITVPGGTIDLRNTQFDGGGGGQTAAGPRRPLTLALNRLIVSDRIQLRNLRADLDLAGGLSGNFSGRIFQGNVIEGTVAQTSEGAAIRLTSNRAGDVLRETGIFAKAKGGQLDLILAPVAGVGTYEGEFTITDPRIVDAPAMASLLSAVSIVGLPDQLQGDGIRFDEVEGRFRLSPTAVTLYRSSAVGPSMGISLDGYYDMRAGQIDMQGVLSPLYIVNALGRVLSPRDGEGLVGFNFTLKGAADKPEVGVNPLSILTPGVLREIFRRAPPTTPETPDP